MVEIQEGRPSKRKPEKVLVISKKVYPVNSPTEEMSVWIEEVSPNCQICHLDEKHIQPAPFGSGLMTTIVMNPIGFFIFMVIGFIIGLFAAGLTGGGVGAFIAGSLGYLLFGGYAGS